MADASTAIRIDVVTAAGEANVRRLNQELNGLTRTAAGGAAANDNYTSSIKRAAGGMSDAANQGNLFSRTINDIRLRAAGANPALAGMTNSLAAMGPAGMAAGAALAVVTGTMVKATSEANKYADVLAKISTNVDTTKFAMGELSDGILKQSAAFGGMPTDQAEAAYDIISAGAEDAATALDILNASNGLAVGGMTKVGVAADGLTSILNSYAGKGLSAASASDSMFIAARDGKTTIEQLSSEIGKVTPLAAAMNVGFDEVTGALAVLTKGGINTSESVTGVRAILSSIAKPSDDAKKKAKELGLEWNVNAVQAKGLGAVLQDLYQKTGGSVSKMSDILGGVESLTPALALTKNKGEEFIKTMEHMATKAGATGEAVKKMLDGSPAAQWNRVTAAANAELVKLGSTASTFAAPAFKFLADNLSTVVGIIQLALIPLAVRMAVVLGGSLLASVTMFAETAALSFYRVAASQGVLAASTATLGSGLSGLLGLFGGPLVIGIGAAAYGIYTLASNSSAARTTVDQLAASAASTAQAAGSTHTQSLLAARGVSTFGGQAGAAAEKLWQMANAARAAAIETAKLNFMKAKGTFDTAYGQTSGGLRRRAGNAWEELKDGNQSIGDAARSVGALAQTGWDALWKPNDKKAGAAANYAYKQASDAYKALQDARNSKQEAYLPKTGPVDKPFADKPDKSKDKGTSEAAKRIKEEQEFWSKLNDELTTAGKFGLELQKQTKEIELHKVLGRDLNATDKERIANAIQNIANAKALTDLAQSTFDLDNKALLARQRASGLSEQEAAVQDALDAKKLAALNAGVDITNGEYQAKLKIYEAAVRTNVEQERYNALLKSAVESSKRVSAEYAAQADLAQTAKERLAVLGAYISGNLKDALGQPISEQMFKSIMAGFDAAALEIKSRPLEVVSSYAGEGSMAAQLAAINKEQANYTNATNAIAASGLDEATKKRMSQDVERAHALGMTKATRIVANKFVDDMTAGISELADLFGGKMGEVLNGFSSAIKSIQGNANGTSGLAQMFSGLNDKLGEGFKNGSASMLDVSKGLRDIGNPMGDLKKAFDPTAGGGALKGIGTAVGGAMAGLQIGEQIGQLGKALGLKGSETGAKIGGAIGGLTGNPIIAAGASVIGGLISSLFYKPKYGQASVTGGAASDISVSGNKGSLKAAAGGAAGSVQAGLAQIASSLGGALGSFDVMIGQYEGKWRVRDSSASGKKALKKVGGEVHDFGKDGADEAIAYAIQNAIKDGAITGIPTWVGNALKEGSAELAASLNDAFKKVVSELDGMTDPLGASVREIINPIDDLITSMKKYGASATDLTKLEEYKSKKMQDLIKQETSSFRSILDDLNGTGGGFTALTQLSSEMEQLTKYQGDLASGKTVDQEDYSGLIDKIMSNAQSIYGVNSSDYQGIVSQVRDATTSAIALVTDKINGASGLTASTGAAATTDAVNTGFDTMAALQGVNNDYAAQQVALLAEVRDGLAQLNSGGGVLSYNGRLVMAY